MNIFANGTVKVLGKWTVCQEEGKKPRKFNSDELSMIESAVVVAGDYGKSVEFHFKNGGIAYISVGRDVNTYVGEVVDASKMMFLTLCKMGENDIHRVEW